MVGSGYARLGAGEIGLLSAASQLDCVWTFEGETRFPGTRPTFDIVGRAETQPAQEGKTHSWLARTGHSIAGALNCRWHRAD